MDIIFLQFLLVVQFLTIIFLNLSKKNMSAAIAYSIQSTAVMIIIFNSFLETNNIYLLLIVLLTLVVKVILAPFFFSRLIKKHTVVFSASTYLNTPLILVVIAGLTSMAHFDRFAPLTNIVPAHQALLALALSSMLISLFLIINRKGALSQIVGILSLENSIVAFVILAGLEQSPGLQVGIIFNIFIWILVANIFMSMIYKHFGSNDVTSMKHLKD